MKRNLKILLIADALFILAGGLFGPIYAIFVQEIGGDLLTAGGAYSAFAVSTGILIYFLSKWENHVKHTEKLVLLGYSLTCIGFLGYLLIQTPLHLFIVQIVFGIATAIINPSYDALYSKNLGKGRFVSDWGKWEAMAKTVTGIAAFSGGLIAKLYGFRILFFIMLGLSVAGLFAASYLIKKS